VHSVLLVRHVSQEAAFHVKSEGAANLLQARLRRDLRAIFT